MEQINFETLLPAFTHLFDKVENIERLLQTRTEPNHEADEPLTIQQAASFLKLSVSTLYGLVSCSAIPVSKKGKSLYFSKQEFMDCIKAKAKTNQRSKRKINRPAGETEKRLLAKHDPEGKLKTSPLSYKRKSGSVEISGDAKDIAVLMWTDWMISKIWLVLLIMVLFDSVPKANLVSLLLQFLK